jgi:hypothetical protein
MTGGLLMISLGVVSDMKYRIKIKKYQTLFALISS